MNFQLSLLLGLTVLISACGKQEFQYIARKKERITPEQMALVIENQNITCSDQKFCPEGIARMFAINFEDASNSATCSAFLVAPDLVMTNSHCVYGQKLSLEKICSGLYFAFPQNGFAYTAQCSKILWKDRKQKSQHHYSSGDRDFALIRLDRNVPITPLNLLQGRLKPASRVFPVVVDQIGGFNARITKLDCRVEKIGPTGVVQLGNCPIISGNSGSPVLDKNNNVIGVIFASSNNKSRKPSDTMNEKIKFSTKGYAFSMEYIHKTLGHLL